ncbi:hypothetical protein PMAYCL1PPCAC_20694, partial [Pristionchus mayeri]
VAYHQIEYGPCYEPIPWLLTISNFIWCCAYVLKPYFIHHTLIRETMVAHFSRKGLLISIVIPSALVLITIYSATGGMGYNIVYLIYEDVYFLTPSPPIFGHLWSCCSGQR